VEIGIEVSQFPEKEYINGIFVAVWFQRLISALSSTNFLNEPTTLRDSAIFFYFFFVNLLPPGHQIISIEQFSYMKVSKIFAALASRYTTR
jgi:hypothetical protein